MPLEIPTRLFREPEALLISGRHFGSFESALSSILYLSFIGDALNFPFTPTELLTNEIVPRNVRTQETSWQKFTKIQ